jgi:hypothetical protein
MLYKGSICDIRLRATSPETDLNDWESAGLSVSGENANSPLTGRFFNSLNMTVDSDQQSLVLKAYLLGNKTSSSAVELGLRKKSTGQIYFLTLSPAQKEDLYERFDIVQSSAMVLMSTDDKGHRQQLKALVRRDSAGVPVLRANEMLAFDYDVTGRPDMLFNGVPSGGTVRLAAPYEGLGSFVNYQHPYRGAASKANSQDDGLGACLFFFDGSSPDAGERLTRPVLPLAPRPVSERDKTPLSDNSVPECKIRCIARFLITSAAL